MAYTDLTDTFGYKVRISSLDLISLMNNDRDVIEYMPFYSRPQLRYASATEVDCRPNNNNFFSDEFDVMFPDGLKLTQISNNPVTKNIFDITRTADWTTVPSGYQGGLRPGLSESNNTWYAIYAVVVYSGSTPISLVLVGDDTLPIQSNFVTLNTRYGTNNWVYLGMIRNGDGWSAQGDIVPFTYARNRCYFTNIDGLRLVIASATTVNWAYSAGLGAFQVPQHIKWALFHVETNADSQSIAVEDNSQNFFYLHSGAHRMIDRCWGDVTKGLYVTGGSVDFKIISFIGFDDPVLGLGYSPQL